MSGFQLKKKKKRHAKKHESMAHTQEEKAINNNYPWGNPNIGLGRQKL